MGIDNPSAGGATQVSPHWREAVKTASRKCGVGMPNKFEPQRGGTEVLRSTATFLFMSAIPLRDSSEAKLDAGRALL